MSNKRREFLRQILAAGVFTVASPHISLGRILPELKEDKNNKDVITGLYNVKISAFPVLSQMWGSVRMVVEGIPPEFKYPKMIVSHIDPGIWNQEFSAVSEDCPHEGYPIELLNPDFVPDPLFECKKGHGSLYLPEGTYFWGVSKKNLVKYALTWDNGDNLYIEIPAFTSTDIESKYPEVCYLSECFPNPASDSIKLLYGLDALSDIDISVYDLKGNLMKNLISSKVPAGHYDLMVNISDLPPGYYFIKMLLKGQIRIIRKLTIIR